VDNRVPRAIGSGELSTSDVNPWCLHPHSINGVFYSRPRLGSGWLPSPTPRLVAYFREWLRA